MNKKTSTENFLVPANRHWLREIGRRLLSFKMLKAVGTPLFMVLFFCVYLFLLRHTLFPVHIMPVTAIDRWIAFTPAALPLYLSLWLYVSLPSSMLERREDLTRYARFVSGLCLVGVACFALWPTAVPVMHPEWSAHPAIGLLAGVDAAGNACPSLHVASAVFSGLWLAVILREIGVPPALGAVNWLWCGGIVYSTLAVRQHVLIDVLAGALLGGLVGVLSLHRRRPVAGRDDPSGTDGA